MKDHAPWSVSKASVAYDCTYRFNLKYAQRRKGTPIVRGEGRIGSACHYIIERMLLGESYEQAFKGGALSNKLTRSETLELHTFRDPIARFMRRLGDFKAKYDVGAEDVLVERKLAVTAAVSPTEDWWNEKGETWLRGAADVLLRVWRDGKKYLIIIDHKSGAPKPLDNYEMQLTAYGVMGVAFEEDVAGVQACIHWPRSDTEEGVFSWGPMWTAAHIQSVLVPKLQAHFAGAQLQSTRDPVPTPGWFCDFCEYQTTCPARVSPQ